MRDALLLYLLVTGVGAAVILAMPGLVLVGLMLLVLPGVVMGALPTAFFWGACFALLWFPLQPALGDGGAALAAVLLASGGLVGVTVPGNLAARATLRRLALPDVRPPERFALSGDVRLDLIGGGQWDQDPSVRVDGSRPYRCDALALAVLGLPGVTSVTLNASRPDGELVPSARTFRIVPRGERGDRLLARPLLSHRVEALGDTPEARRACEAHLLAALVDGCLVMDRAMPRFDVRVRELWEDRFSARAHRWSLGASTPSVRSLVVEDGAGACIARFRRVSITAPRPPLLVGLHMQGMNEIFFRWHRWTHGDPGVGDAMLGAVHALRALTDLGLPAPETDVLDALRSALDAGLSDPGRTDRDPAFASFAPYVRALAHARPTDGDIDLTRRALRDRRVKELYRAHALPEVFGDLTPFRDAMVARIAESTPEESGDAGTLSHHLDRMPPGSFATLTPTEDALLDDPIQRVRAGGLITRLADQGSAAVPRLLALLDAHLPLVDSGRTGAERRVARATHEPVVTAVQDALGRLGPDAASARHRIEQLSTDGSVPAWIGRREAWLAMRVRLGTPIGHVVPPGDAAIEARVRRTVAKLER